MSTGSPDQFRELLGTGAQLLIGMDRVKPVERLIAAYDDPDGITARFNLNLLDQVDLTKVVEGQQVTVKWRGKPLFVYYSYNADDSDRPLVKSDGSYAYFAGDIAYHRDKFTRGFKTMIDVFGADHSGHVKRMKAAVAALTSGEATLDIKICQLVRLFRAGEPVKMSKRAGTFVTLREGKHASTDLRFSAGTIRGLQQQLSYSPTDGQGQRFGSLVSCLGGRTRSALHVRDQVLRHPVGSSEHVREPVPQNHVVGRPRPPVRR